MVGDEHFGGFLTKKAEELDADGRPKTWKQRMEEIILKSKKEKVRRGMGTRELGLWTLLG